MVGRDEPLTVYEVLGRRDAMDGALAVRLAAWERAIALYLGRRWFEASEAFAALAAAAQADGPSRVYLERSRALEARPPADDWNGVFEAETK